MMQKKNGKRIRQIMAWLLLIAFVVTSQNNVMSAKELSEKDVRDDEEVKPLQAFGDVISNNRSHVFMEDGYSGAITANGDLYCWGRNICGQVGNGTTEEQLTPTKVLSNVASVYVRFAYTAAITTNGDLYCWGNNSVGQVGNGTTEDQLTPTKVLSNVVSVSGSGSCIAAITTNGDLYCWGDNSDGQVGNGTWKDQVTPSKVLSNIASVSVSGFHTVAIATNGDLYCWGANDCGQVGNGTWKDQATPSKVLSNVASVSVSNYSTAAITTNGDLYCWGNNSDGQVGNGTTSVTGSGQRTPAKVLSNVASVFCNGLNMAAITTNNDLYIWGHNQSGQVGNGTMEEQLTPTKVLSNVVSVSMGGGLGLSGLHSSAITANGDLYCWGTNLGGQIGNGTMEDQLTPTKVLSNVVSVSRESDFSEAITANGDLYCWGHNGYGQIGNGTIESQLIPTKVLSDIVSVSSGFGHIGAVMANGDLYCWGDNNYGQVGNGTIENQLTPQKIMNLQTGKIYSSESGNANGIEHVTTASNNQIEIYTYDIGNGLEVAKPMKDATVSVDKFGNTLTDADGKAVIENTLTDQPLVNTKVSITKEGYREYYFYKDIYNKDAELLWENNQQTVWLKKLKNEDRNNPYISTLMCQTSYGTTYDAMVNRRIYRSKEKGQNIKIQINAVWNGKTPSSYILYQENGTSYTSTDGKFSLDMGKDFEAKYPIYAKLVSADGTTVTEKTNFEITGSSSSAKPGDSLELINTDSTGTLGEDVAFLSGENVSIKLGGAKLDISVEAGKIKATIGKNKKLSEGEIFSNEDWEEWKKMCEHQPTDLNLSQWKNVIESTDTDWTGNLKGKTEVYGYLEGTINNTGNTLLTGKIKLKTSLSMGIQTQYMIGVVPVYAKISAGADGGLESALVYNWTEKKIDAEKSGITLSLEPYLAAEGGVGVMAVVEVGVEGKGSMPFSTKLGTNDETKLSLKGGLSLKAKLLVFEYSLKLAEKEVKLLPAEQSKYAAWAAGMSELSMDDFQLSDNRYLDEESIWLGDSTIQPFSLETTETGAVERVLKTNINPDADMQMVTAGDTKMIFWTEGDPQRAAINNFKLVYSIYNAADDTWSAPEAVADDGTADFAPSVVSDGEQIYVAWQNIGKTFTNDATLSEVAAASTAVMSAWTAGEGFSNPVTVSESGCMAASPQIALNAEGKPYVAYLQNMDNNLLLTTGQNNIRYSVVDGSDIERKSFVENAGLVTAMDTSFTDSYEISYTLDADNDLSTLEDREIIRKGTANTATQNECMDSNVRYVKNGNRNLRFWYQDGNIVMSDKSGTETVVYQDDTGALTDDFHVVSGQENQLAVIWTAVDEDGNKQIEGSLYDSDKNAWSKSIQISDTDASVYNPQGIFTEDGRLQFLYKKTGDAQTDLCVLMAEPSVNLAVENAYCDETAFVPGSMAKVSVQVKNNGSKKADGFTVDIEGTKTIVSESLSPGESAVAEADYMVPADMGYREIRIEAAVDGDIDTTDNRFSFPVGYTDLAVNVTDSMLAFGQLVEVRAANQSCIDTAATLEVRKGSREGELVKNIDLGTIAKGELVTATYLWNEDADNYSADTETLYFNVVSEKPEKYVDNNYDFTVTESYINQDPGQEPDEDTALKEAKNKAKLELNGYKNPDDYREAQKKELIKAIADGETAIDSAKDEAGVAKALADAKKVIDKIKTDAQLTEEEGVEDVLDIAKATVTLSKDSYIYDGRAKTPGVTVELDGKTLVLNADYTVSYSDNINVGTAKVTVMGIGKYKGIATRNFTISKEENSKISIAEAVITLSQNKYTYDGWQKKPSVTVKLNGKTLKENEDYLVIYHNNIDVGTAQVIIIGKGKYTGHKSIDYAIAKSEKQPDFPIIRCKKKIYKTAYGAKPFTINAISKSKLLFTSSKPAIVSVDKNTGQVTVKGTGIAAITIKAGRKAVSVLVKVSPRKPSLKSVNVVKGRQLTVKWAKDKMATGYQVQVSTAKNFKRNLKTKNISRTSYTFTKLKTGKKYYVRIRSYKKSGMETLYGTWSRMKQSNKIKN